MEKLDQTQYYYFDKDLTIEQIESFTGSTVPLFLIASHENASRFLTFNFNGKSSYGHVVDIPLLNEPLEVFFKKYKAVKVDSSFFKEKEVIPQEIFLKTLSSKTKKFEKLSGNTYFCKLKNNHYRNITFSEMDKDGGVDLKYIQWSTGHNMLVIKGDGAKSVAKRVLKKEPLAKIVTYEDFIKG